MSWSKGAWLITGCSSGIGRYLVQEVLARGGRVAATARDPATLADLVAGSDGRCIALAMDVVDPAQVTAAVAAAEAAFGGIDVLVNNAGRGILGAVEETSDAEARAVFDTNFFGLAAVTRAVLPGMRARRSGYILNVSSIGGLMGSSATATYCASKFAVEGLSEGLAQEVAEFGIKVMIVEPGPFRTGFKGGRIPAQKAIPEYVGVAVRKDAIRAATDNQPGDPRLAAAVICNAVEAPEPPFRLPLGKFAADRAIAIHEARAKEAAAWRDAAISADYPAG